MSVANRDVFVERGDAVLGEATGEVRRALGDLVGASSDGRLELDPAAIPTEVGGRLRDAGFTVGSQGGNGKRTVAVYHHPSHPGRVFTHLVEHRGAGAWQVVKVDLMGGEAGALPTPAADEAS